MSLTPFNSDDTIVVKLDVANSQFNLSSSSQASGSAVWAFWTNSTTAGFLNKPDTSSNSATTISTSSAFRHLANYFFGTNTYVLDSFDKTTQRTTIRCIQVGRPLLDEGLYKNSLTAVLSATLFCITAVDIANVNSDGSPWGLTGQMVNAGNTAETLGTVFYDHGVIIFHGGFGATGNTITNSNSGFSINSTYATRPNDIIISNFTGQTRNVLKRSIFFCRALNTQYNYTTNPTARNNDGSLISSLTSNPATFITTIGLYDDNNNLLAVGKVNPPKKKTYVDESLFSCRLDFLWLLSLVGSYWYLIHNFIH